MGRFHRFESQFIQRFFQYLFHQLFKLLLEDVFQFILQEFIQKITKLRNTNLPTWTHVWWSNVYRFYFTSIGHGLNPRLVCFLVLCICIHHLFLAFILNLLHLIYSFIAITRRNFQNTEVWKSIQIITWSMDSPNEMLGLIIR